MDDTIDGLRHEQDGKTMKCQDPNARGMICLDQPAFQNLLTCGGPPPSPTPTPPVAPTPPPTTSDLPPIPKGN